MLQASGDARPKYQRPRTTKIIQRLWILLALLNGFAAVPQKPAPKCCSELELEGLGVPGTYRGWRGAAVSTVEKEPEFKSVCDLCSVITYRCHASNSWCWEHIFGGKKLFNFFSCRSINLHKWCHSHSPNSLFKLKEFQFCTEVRTTLQSPSR